MRPRRRGEARVFGHLRLGLATVATIVVVGTVGFMLVDGYSLLDALYHTVGLMTTEGGLENARTTAGKVLAAVVVVAGIGSLFYTLGAVAEYLIEGHFGWAIARHRMERKIERLAGHAVICGFGRVGRRIAREFAEVGQPFVVIDKLEANVAELEAAGFLYLRSDATEDATLLEANVRQAQSLLAATDDDAENIAITLSARALARDLWIVARANRDETEGKLVRAGADRVLSPYALGGHRMAGLARQPHLMDFLDTAMKSRELDLALTVIQVEVGSPLVGMPLPASVECLPPGMRDSSVIAVRLAGKGAWLAASRREGRPVAAGDWLVVLGPVDQRQPDSVSEAFMRHLEMGTAPES
ncbi:MAG: potassium channel family protein [Ktedonobacterales bacterium]